MKIYENLCAWFDDSYAVDHVWMNDDSIESNLSHSTMSPRIILTFALTGKAKYAK